VALNALHRGVTSDSLTPPWLYAQNNREAGAERAEVRFVCGHAANPLDPKRVTQTTFQYQMLAPLTITRLINQDGYVNLQVDQTDNARNRRHPVQRAVISQRRRRRKCFP